MIKELGVTNETNWKETKQTILKCSLHENKTKIDKLNLCKIKFRHAKFKHVKK